MPPVNSQGHRVAIHDGSLYAEDVALMRKLSERDIHAFEMLYKRYHTKMVRFVAKIVRKPQIVEEVVNDSMMVMWTKPETYNGTCKLSTWLFAIAYRQSMNALRRSDEPVDDSSVGMIADDNANPEQALHETKVSEIVLREISALSAPHRTVIDLTYIQGLTCQEIAIIMDCPVDTVKTRMFYARKKLKERLCHLQSELL